MKLFIAGIHTEFKADPETNCERIIEKYIPEIAKMAPADAIIVVVLHECALATKAISDDTKDGCLTILQDGLKNYSNILLIPGSFASLKPYASSLPQKYKKIETVYQSRLENVQNRKDVEFIDEFRNFTVQTQRMQKETLDGSIMKHTAYALTKYGKFKHKKVDPFQEYHKLIPPSEKANFQQQAFFQYGGEKLTYTNRPTNLKNWILDLGLTKKTQTIQISDNQSIDLRLLICRDHYQDNQISPEKLPELGVIISDSIGTSLDKLWGAVNIHMDAYDGLNVYVNNLHPYRSRIEEIKAVTLKYRYNPVAVQYANRVVVDESNLSARTMG